MSEHKLIGHETYLEKFVTLYENNELPNKILLSGKKGIGKSLLVEKFLCKIFNSNNDYELIKNNTYRLVEWASLKFDGWIWSDIEVYNDSLFLVTLSGNFSSVLMVTAYSFTG